MPIPVATGVYDVYGRFYDGFEWLFKRRLARAIGAMPFLPGDRVLDIGIGTGLSLEYYPPFVHVTGIDLSAGMLRQAQRKLDAGQVARAPGSTRLLQGDALDLPFGEKSFEVVFLSHMISTVPDPQRCLAEALRVATETAYVVMVNHFRSPYPVINWVESALDPLCRKLGWRSDLSLRDLLERGGVENPAEARRMVQGGVLFQTVFLHKRQPRVRVVPVPTPVAQQAKWDPV